LPFVVDRGKAIDARAQAVVGYRVIEQPREVHWISMVCDQKWESLRVCTA
jgi:hypothetical protein